MSCRTLFPPNTALTDSVHAQTIVIDRVFDLQHSRRGSNGPKCTVLGLEAAGVRHFSVVVDGWHEIHAGVTVTAMFRSAEDWKQLVGWVNHQTGEIITTSPAGSKVLVILMTLLTTVWLGFVFHAGWLWQSQIATRAGLLFGTALLGVVTVVSVVRMRKVSDERRALEEYQTSLIMRQ
jgi:hypothetical protein